MGIEILQLLLESGANTQLVNSEGKVPFVVACEEGFQYCHLPAFAKGRWGWVDPVRSSWRQKAKGSHLLRVVSKGDVSRHSCNCAASLAVPS